MSIGLSGNLRDFGIADVFQLIGQQRKTGELRIRENGNGARLLFDEGAVVSALPELADGGEPLAEMLFRSGWLRREQVQELRAAERTSARTLHRIAQDRGWLSAEELNAVEDRLTHDTIFDALRWEGGTFDFQPRDSVPQRHGAMRLGAEQILMDGLRMLDEWRTFEGRIPSEDTVFRRCGLASDAAESEACEVARSDAGQRLLALVDGRLPVRRIIDLSRLGTFEGTRILASCVEAGLLEPVRARSLPGGWMLWSEGSGQGLGLRGLAEVALPLLALLLVVSMLGTSPVLPSQGESWPIPRTSLEGAAEMEHMRALRKLAEVFHLMESRWPVALEELPARGLVNAKALASPLGHPYHSQGPDGELVLLAPDP